MMKLLMLKTSDNLNAAQTLVKRPYEEWVIVIYLMGGEGQFSHDQNSNAYTYYSICRFIDSEQKCLNALMHTINKGSSVHNRL